MSGIVPETLAVIARSAGRYVSNREHTDTWYADAEVDTYIFSYEKDFAALWGLDIDECGNELCGMDAVVGGLAGRETTIVVVWDGQPVDTNFDHVTVGQYVTPYEWAAVLSLALHRRYGKNSDPEWNPKIRILILNTASNLSDTGFIQRSLFAFHNTFPWIQDYRPVRVDTEMELEYAIDEKDVYNFKRFRQAIPLALRDADYLIKDLLDPKRVLTTFGDDHDYSEHLETVAESWCQELLKAGNRHSVANLVGPLILAQDLSVGLRANALALIEANALPRKALKIILGTLQLLSLKAGMARVGEIGLDSEGGVFGRRRNVRFLLVDDQYRQGYQHIVAYTIFGGLYAPAKAREKEGVWRYDNGKNTLCCVGKWGRLKQTLTTLDAVSDWDLPRQIKVPDSDVLLLDLRLWSEGQKSTRRLFMEELVSVCEYLTSKARIADPKFDKALDCAKQLAQDQDVSELPALSLLPLLISHYDPSFPIVLFSSTHQREVLELVSHRPNIITSFSKPILSGYVSSEQPTDSLRNLATGLRRAIDLHEARVVWERLPSADWKGIPPFQIGIKNNIKKYNTNADDGFNHKPELHGDDLRRRLCFYFLHYILDQRYYDFSSVPYEFIEGCLTPIEAQMEGGNVAFNLSIGSSLVERRRNALALSLKYARNRKVHGHVWPPGEKDTDDWRVSVILMFLVLLDYIEDRSHRLNIGGGEDTLKLRQSMWEHVCSRYGDVMGERLVRENQVENRLKRLAVIGDLPWLPFVSYALAHAIRKSDNVNEKQRYAWASMETFEALKKLVDR